MDEREYTVDELAHMFRTNPETIRRWLRAGRFPNAYRVTIRSGWRVPHSDVEALRRPHREDKT